MKSGVTEKLESLRCCVKSDLSPTVAELINIEVCKSLPIHRFEGESYCILHLPDPNKGLNSEFKDVVAKRIEDRDTEFKFIYVPDTATFFNFTFISDINFHSAIFRGKLNLTNRTFDHGLDFQEAVFEDGIDLSATKFLGAVRFDNATFEKQARFISSAFFDLCCFRGCHFKDYFNIDSTMFLGHFTFEKAHCSGNAYFSVTRFLGRDTEFDGSKFDKRAVFDNSIFLNEISFRAVKFGGQTSFSESLFPDGVIFNKVQFSDKTGFSSTYLEGTSFDDCKVEENATLIFERSRICGHLHFENAEIAGAIRFVGATHDQVFLEPSLVSFTRWNVQKEFDALQSRYKNAGIDVSLVVLDDGDGAGSVSFENAEIAKPERISFFRVRLRANWFVNSDSRSMTFIDASWDNLRVNLGTSHIKQEIQELDKRNVVEPVRLLEIAYRQLAANAEENNRYKEASKFRYLSFETERLEMIANRSLRKNGLRALLRHPIKLSNHIEREVRFKTIRDLIFGFPTDIIHVAYRWLSGYGERWIRAFVWLLVIWFAYAIGFWQFGSFGLDGDTGLNLSSSLAYSLQVMTFQKPEPRPFGILTVALYTLETIMAPLQAALVGLAIRRRFMR